MVDPTFESQKAMKSFLFNSANEVSEIMQVLSHSKRIEILSILLGEDMSFKDLLERIKLQRSSLGNHLIKLVDKDFIEKLDRGIYRLTINGQDFLESIAYRFLDTKVREQIKLEKLQKENMKIFDLYTTVGQRVDEVVIMANKKVLQGIEQVSFRPKDGKYELTPFPQCLKACLVYLGDPYTYEYLMGTSGAAFRLMWHSKQWEGGNVDIKFMHEDPSEPIRRAFEAVGLEINYIVNKGYKLAPDIDFPNNARSVKEEEMKKIIVDTINKTNTPILGFGVIGPPECCIITGYDDNGDILIGWNLFQDEQMIEMVGQSKEEVSYEENGYFRKKNWFKDIHAIIPLNQSKEKKLLKEIYISALEWALEIIRRPKVKNFHNGLVAYTVWAEKLAQDENFPEDNMQILLERKMVHYDAMTMVAERFQAIKFLKSIAEHKDFTKAKEILLLAAQAFEEEYKCMKEWWTVIGNIWDDELAQIKIMANHEIRKKFIPFIIKARENDEKGANFIEKALALI